MVICAEVFAEYLRARELAFDVRESESGLCYVRVPFEGRITNVIFENEDNGTHVALRTAFEQCPPEKVPDLLVVCNALNVQYRWLKFCIDDENAIMVEDDAIVSPETAGEECFELVLRTVQILQEVKPTIMRAIYA